MKSVVIIVDYFGREWPEWFPLFLESCSRNPSINWIIHSDCAESGAIGSNVIVFRMTWLQYKAHVSRKLGISFDAANAYKICDLRPAYGVIWEDEIAGFDFFGWGDIDVIYGDLRRFLTDSVLANNVISTHAWCFSGHFCLFRNQRWIRNAFRKLRHWRKVMESQESLRFDEDHLIRVFSRPNRFTPKWCKLLAWIADRANPLRAKYRKTYLVEQFTTPLVPGLWRGSSTKHSDVWYWRDGKITNKENGDRQFMYLHFMNYVSGRWMDKHYGTHAPWAEMEKLLKFDPALAKRGFRIDLNGFWLLDE
jgi:hypothetical protein